VLILFEDLQEKKESLFFHVTVVSKCVLGLIRPLRTPTNAVEEHVGHQMVGRDKKFNCVVGYINRPYTLYFIWRRDGLIPLENQCDTIFVSFHRVFLKLAQN
jgi:hypothetical protein